jgi:hypothetical protein
MTRNESVQGELLAATWWLWVSASSFVIDCTRITSGLVGAGYITRLSWYTAPCVALRPVRAVPSVRPSGGYLFNAGHHSATGQHAGCRQLPHQLPRQLPCRAGSGGGERLASQQALMADILLARPLCRRAR